MAGLHAVTEHAHVEGLPLLDEIAALDDRLDGGVEVVPLRLREEADVSEVDAEQRRDGLARELGSPQDRPVAADDQGELASGRGVGVGGDDLGPPSR